MDYKQLNGLSLAYMGDAVYEVAIREYLINRGSTKPNKLHRLATHYVSAKAQASLINKMLEQNILTDEELQIYQRGRNAKSHTSAKNTNIRVYRMSTGFEALIGYLYFQDDKNRLEEILQWCIDNGGEKLGK